MYHTIVRRRVLAGFRQLNVGNYEAVLQQFDSAIAFSFSGTHALGGSRSGIDSVREWFQQLFQFFPGIQFEIRDILVNGPPWNTIVATRFSVRAQTPREELYTNAGMQFLRIRWGRIVEDHLYEDTQKLASELEALARHDSGMATEN